MASTYAELDIQLYNAAPRQDPAAPSSGPPPSYRVELHFIDPDPENQAQRALKRGETAIDLGALRQSELDPEEYGRKLTEQLFSDPIIRQEYFQAEAAVAGSERFLRLRLVVDPGAAELHGLRWELLRDPETGDPLATSERILFFRFLTHQGWRPVRLRPRAEVKALIAVSAPTNLAEYRLAEVDAEGEIARARESLGDIAATVIGGAQQAPLTLDRLREGLREEPDILYLVCHGTLKDGEPVLWLQTDERQAAHVEGAELARRIRELKEPPRLVVLASCESGGKEDGAAHGALASRLAVPAVVAMQGRISMKTVEKALPVFFAELARDGQIDRAMAVARGAVRERPDSWMPVLYMRLKDGRIWHPYRPRFAGEGDTLKRWKAIVNNVRRKRFVPILGPGVAEHLYGTTRELTLRLAREHGFPLSPRRRGDLAKVAQYLSVQEDHSLACDEIDDHRHELLGERHKEEVWE